MPFAPDPAHLRVLRDRASSTPAFRKAARALCAALVKELSARLRKRGIAGEDIVLAFVLRSAMAFLDPSLRAFPHACVAVAGLRRDEKTALASWYYENVPPVGDGRTVVIFDPMLATGGSAAETVHMLVRRGADPERIHFVGVLAAPEGVARLAELIPRRNILVARTDKGLDARKFIVPGLGDFGDRYLGTHAEA